MAPSKQLTIPLDPVDPGTYARRASSVYGVHAYHTKVPPEAIVSHLHAHTSRGDVVLDPFCGSGMTGLAALMAGRRALLSDLSPAAIHIAGNYTTRCDPRAFSAAVERVRAAVGEQVQAMYATSYVGAPATVEYVVWSDQRACPSCGHTFALWDLREQGLRSLVCPKCGLTGLKNTFPLVGERPVLANLSTGERRRVERSATEADLGLSAIPASLPWHPNHPFGPERPMWRRGHADLGIETVDGFYSPRNLAALSLLWEAASSEEDPRLKSALRFSLTAIANRASRRYQWNAKRPTNVLGSTLYISSIRYEWNVLSLWRRKVKAVHKLFSSGLDGDVEIVRASATRLPWPSGVADYCFTDPPFGGHIVYSDSSLLWEAWLDDLMSREDEAIVVAQGSNAKTVAEYRDLMEASLCEIRRVLKPRAAATVVFQATDTAVWRAIENACEGSGFAIDDASILTKGQPSFKQIKGKGDGERVAASDVVLTLRPHTRRRRSSTVSSTVDLPYVLRQEIERDPIGATSGHLFGIAAAAALRSAVDPSSFDHVIDVLRENFDEAGGIWRLRNNGPLAA